MANTRTDKVYCLGNSRSYSNLRQALSALHSLPYHGRSEIKYLATSYQILPKNARSSIHVYGEQTCQVENPGDTTFIVMATR
jgi:hypothetical protein